MGLFGFGKGKRGGDSGSDAAYEYLAKRDVDDKRMAQSQLLRRLVGLSHMGQVSVLLGLWRKGYDLFAMMFEPVPQEMDETTLAKTMQARMALSFALAEEKQTSALRTRTDLTASHRRFSDALVQAARLRAGAWGLLAKPLMPAGPAFSPRGALTIARWGYFNPNGPTFCDLTLECAPDGQGWLLVFNSAHPFSPHSTVYGLLTEEQASNPARLIGTLRYLLESDDMEDHRPMASLPTHLEVPEDSPLTARQFAEVLRLLAMGQDDLLSECDAMRRFWCKPWERTGSQVDDLLAGLLAGKQDLEGFLEAHAAKNAARPVRPQDFDLWYELATHRDHVAAELDQMPLAWVGSVLQLRGQFKG